MSVATSAQFYQTLDNKAVKCELCPHYCLMAENQRGNCGVRENRDGKLLALAYNQICSLALDPIEKKPLYHFHRGEKILSLGSWGCNFHCAFCQNWGISQQAAPTQNFTADDLITNAKKQQTNLIAYTYNEPYINFEYVADCCQAARCAGMKNVLVTNGFYNPAPMEKLLPLIDALNIDLKAFTEDFYHRHCGGALSPVLATIKTAAQLCHLEITTLIIPHENDQDENLHQQAEWIANNCGRATPLHLSAYFPRYKFSTPATSRVILERARAICQTSLDNVYLGNV